MSNPKPGPPPQDKNDQAVVIRFSRIQFLAIVVISSAFLSLVVYLVQDIYGGIKEDMKETKERVNKLNESFQSAYKAAIDVQQLITTSRDLQHDITEIRERVIKLETEYVVTPQGPPAPATPSASALKRH